MNNTLNTPRIHLIERKGIMRQIKAGGTEWESGYWWRLGLHNAKALIGGKIYFHKTKKSLSHAGGKIIGYRLPHPDERQQSIIFIYDVPENEASDFIGITAGSDNWTGGGVRKIVLN